MLNALKCWKNSPGIILYLQDAGCSKRKGRKHAMQEEGARDGKRKIK